MSDFIRQNRNSTVFSRAGSWVILSSIEEQIKAKIEAIGTPLKDWNISINYGIKTGLNDAFIIDGNKRNELINQDPKSAEIIRPILRGRDIKRYGFEDPGLWLINTHNGIKEKDVSPIVIDNYPAIKKHLDQYFSKLDRRSDKGDTPYNLRNCAYMDDFFKQKIIWGEISDKANFALDNHGEYFVNNKCYLLTGNKLEYLVCFLNSPLAEYLFSKIATTTGVGTLQWSKFTIEQLRVPAVEEDTEQRFKQLLHKLLEGSVDKAHINNLIYEICGLTGEEIAFVEAK